jgi:hypothetical protein
LHAELLHRRAVADQGRSAFPVPFVQRTKGQCALEDLLQVAGIAGLGNKVGCAERAGMARITVIALAGEDNDANLWRHFQQVGNQRKTLIRAMRRRWQSEVNQRQFRRSAQLSKQLQAVRARMAGNHFKQRRHRKTQAVTDQRVVVNDEQQRLFGQ